MVHPEYKQVADSHQPVTETCLTPVYPLTEGINQSILRKAIKQAIALCRADPHLLTDWLPAAILAQYHYPTLLAAINTLHAPTPDITLDDLQSGSAPALKRLAFEEFLAHHLSLKLSKQKIMAWQAPRFSVADADKNQFIQNLPFTLTEAQMRVIAEIAADCDQPHPMMRLVQGDVGSGKTVVAAYAAFLANRSGYQVTIMAPTEILAEQHYRNFSAWFETFDTTIALLTSAVKGNARKLILQALADGAASIIVGTHALFQDEVTFHRLGLIIIDEQPPFWRTPTLGVESQRPAKK